MVEDTDTTDYSLEEYAQARFELTRPIPTGARIVVARQGDKSLSSLVADACASFDATAQVATFTTEADLDSLNHSDAVVFEELGLAVLDHNDGFDATTSMTEFITSSGSVEDSYPEFYAFADEAPASAHFLDTATYTWGLQATRTDVCSYTGKGIRVAVLDTGIDLQHPDFTGRIADSRSFVAGESVDDLNGHGTHCCGTVAGPMGASPRYGVAPDVELIVGKVLSNRGSGRQRDILAAMLWSVQQGAQVISMSLGRPTRPGEPFDPAYERAAAYALENGSLIVAAAGNESERRFGFIAPVGAPANSPSILAVAALDQSLMEADFSCGGINDNGGEVDIAAPGVAIYSSWPLPRGYRRLSGTSMACPHVAGLAALHAESSGGLRGTALAQQVIASVQDIGRPQRDTGAGLAIAP